MRPEYTTEARKPLYVVKADDGKPMLSTEWQATHLDIVCDDPTPEECIYWWQFWKKQEEQDERTFWYHFQRD